MSKDSDDNPTQGRQGSTNSTYAAVARTLTRGAALYFSRPVRIFRPSKSKCFYILRVRPFANVPPEIEVSGWHSLRGLAASDGTSLSPHFVRRLVRTQGVCTNKHSSFTLISLINFSKLLVIPKHFVPPLLVNAVLGTVLWTAYSESSSLLSGWDSLEAHPIAAAAISGAIAGGAQAIVAAPAENARLAIEGGTAGGRWSHAWKEVIRGTVQNQSTEKKSLHEIRQVRGWMLDVRDMAGRGWNGWGWGLAKDVCGEPGSTLFFQRASHITSSIYRVFSVFRDFRGYPSSCHGA